MEPNILEAIMRNSLIYGGPFISFMFGVFICDRLKLYNVPRSNLYLMAVPISFLIVGLLVSNTQVVFEKDGDLQVMFGHLKDFGQYIIFSGILMLYGTLAPSLFDRFRNSLEHKDEEPKI